MLVTKTKQNADRPETAEAAAGNGTPTISRPFMHDTRRTAIIVVCLILVVVCIGAADWWLAHRKTSEGDSGALAAEQAALQRSLATDLGRSDNQAVVDDTSKLIDGKQAGKFTFSNKLLAEYYMYTGAAHESLKEYAKAIACFKAAPKYDSAEAKAALQGELSSGYAAGERQQLIPILQQLASMSQHSNGLSPSAAQYQSDIQALKQNQQVDL